MQNNGGCPGGCWRLKLTDALHLPKVQFLTGAKFMITLKMADQGRSDFCVVFTMNLCALELKQLFISLLFQIIRLWYKV